ncbi:MAG: peptide-binding protein [Deltaproteobacteria bacterium]|jgi:peptide/nickel transport system substrate-binding protein|nr:peptide-binding protein [Deltaproteobacteria bacterium]
MSRWNIFARSGSLRFLVLGAFILSGAGVFSANATQAPPASPVYGDVRIEGSLGEPSNLIPPLSSDTASSQVTGHMYISLLRYNRNLEIETEAAESYAVLDDGLRLRFTLRKDLFWEDGRPLGVDDVEFTFRLMIDPSTPTAYAGDYLRVKEFRRLDERSFEVTYEKPYARALISWMLSILPRHALEHADLRTTPLRRAPVGSGPFRLKSWEPGSRLTLLANELYFKGRPRLDGLVVRLIPDLSTMFMELRAGKLDAAGLTPQQYVYQTGEGDFGDRYNIYSYLGLGYVFMGYNLRSPLFSDKRVRQAFAMAVNKDDIINGVLFGQGLPVIGPYMPGSWVYNEGIRPYPHDPEAASALLAECGWRKGPDGLLTRDGRPFEFTILVNQGNEQRTKIAVIIQSHLKRLGVVAHIRTVEWAAFLNDFVNKGYFDALILGWSTTLDPDLHSVWHSSNSFEGGLNFVGFSNVEVDELIEAGRSTFDEEARKKYYGRIQEILHEEQPYMFLYAPYAFSAVHRRFQGLDPVPVLGVEHNLPEWWVPEERQLYRNLLKP